MKSHNDNEEFLLKLDKEFDKATAENGVDAWVSYFAENGVMLTGSGPIVGKSSIYQAMEKVFSQSGFSLRWEPKYSKAPNDGTLGYTYGEYIKTLLDNEGNIIKSKGHYTSIWEKQDNGEWKIVLDMGN